MKHMKKLASLLLALVMVFAMGTTAFAAQEGELTGGSITINNAVKDQTYSIYQILYLESYSTDANGNATGAYAYKANSAWADWLKTQTSYVSIDAQGYVTWKDQSYTKITTATDGYESATDEQLAVANAQAQQSANEAGAAAFAKAALAYAKTNNIASDPTAVTATSTTVSFTGLKLGYYLVDSTLGTLCYLDTTNPSVTIQEKNEAPSNEKEVQEDSKVPEEEENDDSWGSVNDADIGQTVNFQSTITAQAGAENYVFHDKMDDGLTFGGSVTVKLNNQNVSAEVTNNDGTKVTNYTFTDYTVEDATTPTDGCTFEVKFTQAFCDTLKANDEIVISYTATVNKDAVVGGNGNKNESKIEYGEEGKTTTTPPSETITYTWDVDVFKYTREGETEKPLAGAKFTLSKKADGTDPITLVNEGNNVYRVATKDDTNTVTEITTDATGKFTIKGLDSDTYYLTETAAPAGYNKLAGPIKIVIADTDATDANSTSTKGTVTYYNYDASDATDHYGDTPDGTGEIQVLNQTGAELPSTGGMGTTIFYVLGGILAVGAAILLITKKRMDAEK